MKKRISILRQFLPELKKYWIWAFLMVIGMTIGAATDIAVPFFIRNIVDLLNENTKENYELIINNLRYIGIAFIIMFFAWRMNEFAIVKFETQGMRDIFARSFRKIQEHSFRFFSESFTGALVKKVARFVHAFESITDVFYFNFLNQLLNISIILVIFFFQDKTLGWIFLVWTVLFLIGNYITAMWKMKYDRLAAESDSKVSGALADAFTNYSTVKIFGEESFEDSRFAKVLNTWFKRTKFTWNLTNVVNAVQAALMITLELVVLYIAVQLWKEGKFTAGDFVFLQSYLFIVFSRLWDFGRNIRNFFSHMANAYEMAEIFERDIEVKDYEKSIDLHVSKGLIEFKNVNFAYAEGEKKLFRDFDLTIKAGEKVALVGHTGEGKSTIVKLLLRFYDIQSGKILIDGQDISKVKQESLRKNISLVPQDPGLFHRSIEENIAYGNPSANKDDVVEAAKKAQADCFIKEFPEEYNTLVGERGVKLSGGERQRVAIARAVLEKAKILILDEATSSLDSVTETRIQKAIENALKGKTAIIIAHRLSTIKKVDRVIVLDKGKIAEMGTHDSLLQKKGKYAELWTHQVGGFMVD